MSADLITTTPATLAGSSELLDQLVARTLAADVKGGQALWEKSEAVADARACCAPGEWGEFLRRTAMHEKAAQRHIRIAKLGRERDDFRDAVIRGWLGFSVAALATQADEQLLGELLTRDEAPSRREVEQLVRPAAPDTGVGSPALADALTDAELTDLSRLAGWEYQGTATTPGGLTVIVMRDDWTGDRLGLDRRTPEGWRLHLAELRELEAVKERRADLERRGIAPHTLEHLVPADWDHWRDRAAALPGGSLTMAQHGPKTLAVNGVVAARGSWEKVTKAIETHEARYQALPPAAETEREMQALASARAVVVELIARGDLDGARAQLFHVASHDLTIAAALEREIERAAAPTAPPAGALPPAPAEPFDLGAWQRRCREIGAQLAALPAAWALVEPDGAHSSYPRSGGHEPLLARISHLLRAATTTTPAEPDEPAPVEAGNDDARYARAERVLGGLLAKLDAEEAHLLAALLSDDYDGRTPATDELWDLWTTLAQQAPQTLAWAFGEGAAALKAAA